MITPINNAVTAVNLLACPPFCTASSSMSSPWLVKYQKNHQ
jgi:hypothetical protein